MGNSISALEQNRALSPTWRTDLSFLWLALTNRCNLTCVHCYAESSPHEPLSSAMGRADWMSVINAAYDEGCRAIQFIGGEPTIHPDLGALIECASDCGYSFIEVFTNGISVKRALFDTFVVHKVKLAFSVYGHTPDVHDGITKHPGSFERTIASIQRSLELGIEIRVGVIEMPENRHQIQDTLVHLRAIGVKNVKSDRQRGIGRGAKLNLTVPPDSQLCGSCWKGSLAIDAEGNVYPCVMSRHHKIGDIRDGLGRLLHSSSLTLFRERSRDRSVFALKNYLRDGSAPNNLCKPYHGPCTPDFCNPRDEPCMPGQDCEPTTCIPSSCTPIDG